MNTLPLLNPQKGGRLKEFALQLFFVALIFLGGELGLLLPFVNFNVSMMWPPAGIALAILLLFGGRFFPAVVLGTFVTSGVLPLFHRETVPYAVGILSTIGSTLSAWIAYSAFRWFQLSLDLDRPKNLFYFLLVSVMGATLTAASIGGFSLALFNVIPVDVIGMKIVTWWIGDAMGVLLITPFCLCWRRFPNWRAPQWAEWGLVFVVILILAELIFNVFGISSINPSPKTFLIFPVLFWVGTRFYQRGITLCMILFGGLGIYATINAHGLFKNDQDLEGLFLLQGYLFVIACSGLFLAAIQQEREKSTQELKESLALHQKTADRLLLATKSAHIGVWDYDIPNNNLFWDEGMYELYGVAPSDAHHYETWVRSLHPEDRVQAEEDIQTALRMKQNFDSAFRIVRPDGTILHIKAFAHLQTDRAGNPIRMMGINWDQSKIKEAEAQLIKGKEAAEAADRSKSEFLAMMSHEIRTPMNGVIGFARLLKGTELSEEQQEFVGIIETSGLSLMNLLNDILDLSKIEAGKIVLEKHPAEIGPLIQDLCTLFRLKAKEKGITLELSLDPRIPSALWTDPTRLKQIFQNLISNAIKFTSKGKITVNVRVLEEPIPSFGEITLEIIVQDTGIGIDPAVIPLLFNPFMQADSSTTRRFGGTGLGLVIIKRLSELMGGSVRVESELGQGSTFFCTFKATASSAESMESFFSK